MVLVAPAEAPHQFHVFQNQPSPGGTGAGVRAWGGPQRRTVPTHTHPPRFGSSWVVVVELEALVVVVELSRVVVVVVVDVVAVVVAAVVVVVVVLVALGARKPPREARRPAGGS